ncbi:unnamed protein product, partial [Brugia timori]
MGGRQSSQVSHEVAQSEVSKFSCPYQSAKDQSADSKEKNMIKSMASECPKYQDREKTDGQGGCTSGSEFNELNAMPPPNQKP